MKKIVSIEIPVEHLEAYYWITDVKQQGLTSCAHRNMKELSGKTATTVCFESQAEKQKTFYAECYELYKKFAIE